MLIPDLGFPTTVILDRNGIIQGVWLGYGRGAEAQMEDLIKKLLAEK